MLFDQPGHALGVGGRQAEARAQLTRNSAAADRMVLAAPFGDVVEKAGDIERRAMGEMRHDLGDQRQLFDAPPGLDRVQRADGAQQVLVHGVVVIHRELHHPDDMAEFWDKAPQHAGLVHAAQGEFGRAARRQDFDEQLVRFRVFAHLLVDQAQVLRHQPRRRRVDRQVRTVGHPEQADKIDGIAREHIVGDRGNALIVDAKVRRILHRARPAAQL